MAADSEGGRRTAAVRDIVRVFNEDRVAWLERLAEDAVLQTDPAWPDGGRFDGRTAIGEFMGQFDEAWSSASFEMTDSEEVGEAVLARGRWVVRGTASGANVDVGFSAVVFVNERAQLRSAHVFFDHDQAAEFARTASADRTVS